MVELVILLFVVLAVACFGLLLPTVVIILAASYLLTPKSGVRDLSRAATRRDMLEARWREESAGSVSEESHESA